MSFPRRSSAIAAATLSLAILTTGCNTKVSQCNKLIKVANAAATELKDISKQGGSQEDRMQQMQNFSVALDQQSKEVQNVQLEDEKLKGFQTRLSQLYTTSSEASRALLEAAKAKNVKGLKESLTKLSSGSKTETEIVSELNGYCQAK